MSALLSELESDPAVRFARLHASDGYTAVLPLDQLSACLLAYEIDSAPLPLEHGFPARLIAPGLGGYKMPKWINRIDLTASPDGGFWEARGASLDGAAAVTAAILSHDLQPNGARRLTGVAYAGARAVQSVSVSVDGGGWMPVDFTPAEPGALTHWQIAWTPPGAGDYQLRVRASDGSTSAEHALVIKLR